jgi:hypothetical protein
MKNGLWYWLARLPVVMCSVICVVGLLSSCAPKGTDVVETDVVYVDNPITIPDLQDEVIPANDNDDLVWVPGWWDYEDGEWAWTEGDWEAVPFEDAVWQPGYWAYDDDVDQWYWAGGYWKYGTDPLVVSKVIDIPDLLDEEAVEQTDDDTVWVDGWWDWDGDWDWVAGAWVVPPDDDAVWVPGHWQQNDWGDWRWVTGYWMIR